MKIKPEELKEKAQKIIACFDKDAVIYLILIIGITGYGCYKFIMPGFSDLFANAKVFSQKNEEVGAMQKRFELRKKESEEKKQLKKTELPIKIYKTPYANMELENAASMLINQIIGIIKENRPTKILSLQFEEKPLVDNFGVNSKKFSILKLKIELNTSYDSIQNIINEIYLMDYLVQIENVSLNSLKEYNYKKVQAYLGLNLVIQTSS